MARLPVLLGGSPPAPAGAAGPCRTPSRPVLSLPAGSLDTPGLTLALGITPTRADALPGLQGGSGVGHRADGGGGRGCSLGLHTGPGDLFPAPASVVLGWSAWVLPAPTLQVSRAEPRPLYLPWPERASWALRQGVGGKELRGREAPSSLRNWASAHG